MSSRYCTYASAFIKLIYFNTHTGCVNYSKGDCYFSFMRSLACLHGSHGFQEFFAQIACCITLH